MRIQPYYIMCGVWFFCLPVWPVLFLGSYIGCSILVTIAAIGISCWFVEFSSAKANDWEVDGQDYARLILFISVTIMLDIIPTCLISLLSVPLASTFHLFVISLGAVIITPLIE